MRRQRQTIRRRSRTACGVETCWRGVGATTPCGDVQITERRNSIAPVAGLATGKSTRISRPGSDRPLFPHPDERLIFPAATLAFIRSYVMSRLYCALALAPLLWLAAVPCYSADDKVGATAYFPLEVGTAWHYRV